MSAPSTTSTTTTPVSPASRHSPRQSLVYRPSNLCTSPVGTGLAGSTFSLPIPVVAPTGVVTCTLPSSGSPHGPGTPTTEKAPKSGKSLSMDRAAFLLIRIKRAFQKKKRNRNLQDKLEAKQKPPLLRAKTLPAIIPPALSIISAQLSTKNVSVAPFAENANVPSPELLSACKESSYFMAEGTSPRHSVSSNSSTGSTNNYSMATNATFSSMGKEKKGLSKLTRLLSNNPGHKISSAMITGNGGLTASFSSAIFWNRSSTAANPVPLCQDGFTDSSCFFWNNRNNGSKMKRTGSMDSLLSTNQIKMSTTDYDGAGLKATVQAGGNGGESMCDHRTSIVSSDGTNIELDSPSLLSARHPLLTSKYSNLSIKSNRSAMAMLTDGRLMFADGALGPPSGFTGVGQHSFYAGKAPPSKHSLGSKETKSSGKQRHQSIDINGKIVITNLKKSDKKKLNNLNFIYERALSSAVASEQLNLVKMVFENTNVNVNSEDEDGLTPLDIAVMLRNTDIIKYLLKRGAQEGDKWRNNPYKESHLARLLEEAKSHTWELELYLRQMLQLGASGGGLSSALLREKETQLTACQRKVNLMQRLLNGLQLLEPPCPPLSVQVEAVGHTSLMVSYLPPIRLKEKKNIITRYKIEWSNNQFSTLLGSYEITNFKTERNEFVIRDLQPDDYYYVRIASGNLKGYSEYCYPLIEYAVPSSWKSVDNRPTITDNERATQVDELLKKVVNIRNNATDNTKSKLATELDVCPSSSSAVASVGSTKQSSDRKVRMSFKNLNFFGTPNRFQKTMKRGVYFACFIYHRDRVLVTNEEVLPIVEIDENFSSSFQADFNWLLKISCTWEDAKALRKDYAQLEKMQNTAAQFRCRILLAIEQMQNSLGIQDLGTMFHKPLRDGEGAVVFCSIRSLEDAKIISALSLRWLPLEKMHKRLACLQLQTVAKEQASFSERISDSGISVTGSGETSSRLIGEILLATLDEMMHYHQACSNKLSRGLYIGYLRLKSTLDLMSIMVSKSHPNTLPYAKIRDNPHVSKLEWQALRQCLTSDTVPTTGTSMLTKSLLPTSASQLHLATLSSANSQPSTGDATPTSKTLAPPGTAGHTNLTACNSLSGSHLSLRPASVEPNSSKCYLTNFLDLVQGASPKKDEDSDGSEKDGSHQAPASKPLSPFGLSVSEKLTFQKLLKFLQAVTQASGHLLQQIGVTEGQLCDVHRFYSLELIELSADICFILLLPPPEEVCTIFNQNDCLHTLTDQIYLPLKIFEIIHMNTYQPTFTSKYSRVSALLELEIEHARHESREAFYSNNESSTKARLTRLQEYQKSLDENFRSLRWIMDVINYARSRELIVGVPLADVADVLQSIDRELLAETASGRLLTSGGLGDAHDHEDGDGNDGRVTFLPPGVISIPFISLSSPGDYPETSGQMDECGTTREDDSSSSSSGSPSPALPPPPDCLSRRKSRDDSYLEEINRQHTHLQNIHHHPHHPRYFNFHQLNRSESLDSNDLPTKDSEDGKDTDGDKRIQLQASPPMVTAISAPPSGTFINPLADSSPSAGYECPKSSSFSLLNSISSRDLEQSSCSVDRKVLDDMRRCVSASKLLSTSCNDRAPMSAESVSGASNTPSPEYLATGDYYFPSNMTTTNTHPKTETPAWDVHAHHGSQVSVNSIALDEAIYSAGTSRRQSDESTGVTALPTLARYDYTENYRPLSRVQFSSECINQPLAEEDEEELLPSARGSLDREPSPSTVPDPFGQPCSLAPSECSYPQLSFHDNFVDILSINETSECNPKRWARRSKSSEARQSRWHRFHSKHDSEHSNKTTTKRKHRGDYCSKCCCPKHLSSGEESCEDYRRHASKRIQSHRRARRRSHSSCLDLRSIQYTEEWLIANQKGNGWSTTDLVARPQSRQVCLYTAFECEALPLGTSIRVRVNQTTLVGDIIHSIIDYCRQHPKRSNNRGPIRLEAAKTECDHDASKCKRFGLLAVYACNVKQLNSNFAILNLQSPWNKARLCLKLHDSSRDKSKTVKLLSQEECAWVSTTTTTTSRSSTSSADCCCATCSTITLSDSLATE